MALALGLWDVDRLLAEMPADLWDRWQLYFEAEPWGGPHEDLRFGYLLSLLSAANGGKLRDPADWFPTLRRQLDGPLPTEIRVAQWKAYIATQKGAKRTL